MFKDASLRSSVLSSLSPLAKLSAIHGNKETVKPARFIVYLRARRTRLNLLKVNLIYSFEFRETTSLAKATLNLAAK